MLLQYKDPSKLTFAEAKTLGKWLHRDSCWERVPLAPEVSEAWNNHSPSWLAGYAAQ